MQIPALLAGVLGGVFVIGIFVSGVLVQKYVLSEPAEVVMTKTPGENSLLLANVSDVISNPSPSPVISEEPSPSPKASPKASPKPSPKPSPTPSPLSAPSPSPSPLGSFGIRSVSPSSVNNATGQLIVIEGIGFVNGSNVMIGPTFLTKLDYTFTRITVRLPEGFPRGTHDVSIYNDDGSRATLAGALTVTGTSDSPTFSPVATPSPSVAPSPSPTPSPTDTLAPTIIGLTYRNITSNSVEIIWDTNELAVGRLYFGANSSNLIATGWTTSYATSHVILMGNLSPDTQYFYRAQGKDASENASLPVPDPASQEPFSIRTSSPQ